MNHEGVRNDEAIAKMIRFLNRPITFLNKNPLITLLLAAAYVLGILTAAPLLGWQLPESAASLIGSITGAVVAIAGSMWLWRHQERERSKIAAELVGPTLTKFEFACGVTANNISLSSSKDEQINSTRTIWEHAQEVDRVLNRIVGLLSQLDAKSARWIILCEQENIDLINSLHFWLNTERYFERQDAASSIQKRLLNAKHVFEMARKTVYAPH